MDASAHQRLLGLAGEQGGVVTLQQAASLGVDRKRIARQVASGQWVKLARGILQVHGGQTSPQGWAWGGVLLAGEGSLVMGEAAAYLLGMADSFPEVVHVAHPEGRQFRAVSRWQFVRRRTMPEGRGWPPRTSVEDTVLDLVNLAPHRAEHWVTEALRRRLTTRNRLREAVIGRSRLAGRAEVLALLSAEDEGLESPLERLYQRRVERAHGLPRSRRQMRGPGQRRDVSYVEQGVVVELDGRLGHEGTGRFRDMRRDNANLVAGLVTLRFGWADCRHRACEVAHQVAVVLRSRGWEGDLTPCESCRLKIA